MSSVPLVLAVAVAAACAPQADKTPAADSAAAAAQTPAPLDTVVLETSRGEIVMELNAEKAPETVANFLRHVKAGFYDGLIFHRIEAGFVIQGGGLTETGAQRKSSIFPLRNEAQNGLKNQRGTVAMARTADPHSATTEFFINLKDNAKLDFSAPTIEGWGYAVFGRVIAGMDVVDQIAKSPTRVRGPHRHWPQEPTIIRRAYVRGADAPAPSP